MKTLFFVLILSLPFLSHAQANFAPAGSEWYHSQQYGVFHSYYTSDTTISGTSCRKVIREALTTDPWYSWGLHVSNLSTLFVYNTTDTVFVYNQFFHRFTPLYVFNVSDGDTIRLPILPPDCDYMNFISTDSTFSVRVDSVRMKLYDTAILKTVYTHPLGNSSTNYVYSYSGSDTLGAYAQRIGSITAGLMPRGEPSTKLATESLQYANSIRCYNDPSLSIKLVSGICGIPPTQVLPVENMEGISLYPSPATNEIIIAASERINCLVIGNLMGQTIHRQEYNEARVQVDISALPAGVYFVKINGNEVRRFVKQ